MLREEVPGVGGRVFTNRPSVLFKEELPAICVAYGDDPRTVLSGSDFKVKEYRSDQQINIVIAMEATTEGAESTEDELDYFGQQVENAFKRDWRLARRLVGFDPSGHTTGLSHGHRILSGRTYETTDGEKPLLVREIRFVVPYQQASYVPVRSPYFREMYVEVLTSIYTSAPVTIGYHLAIDIDFDTPQGGVSLGTIPAGKTAAFVVVIVSEAFDGAAYVTIGDTQDNSRLFGSPDALLDTENMYMTPPLYEYESGSEIFLYLFGSPTVGEAKAVVYYQ
jgi:hypothetical protein